jgi:outer membrane protein TolC
MAKNFQMKLQTLFLFMLGMGMAGCASYHPLPLDDKVTLEASASHLTVDAKSLPFHVLSTHKFDPSDGWDMTEVAMLAVANNPNLKLARDDAKIGHAQAFAAGLLPDPQVNLSRDIPVQPAPGVFKAFGAGVGYDLGSLVTHAASSSAGRFESQKTDLNLLWQEWQVVAQARLLFSRAIAQDSLLLWLTDNRNLLAGRYANAKSALNDGNLTSDAFNATLSAWQDISRQANELERQQLQTRNDLDALLGLAPGTDFKLVDDEALGIPDESEVDQALTELTERRPDLMALKAGYAAEDARYRQAILAQFPPFNLAINRTRDNTGVNMQGFALSLALPIFNGNRGNIRIEEATRQRLRDEYQIRLNSAYAEVKRLVVDSRLLAAQLQMSEAGLLTFDETAANAAQALAQGDLDGSGYAIFQSSRIAKHVEVTNLRQALLENRIALLTLLGGNFDTRNEIEEKHP